MKASAAIDGRTTHYTSTGEGDPVLVLGDPDGTAAFDLLSDWYRLLAPEGLADAAVADVTAFIEHLDLWPVRILGWGEGAGTALRLAMERPDLVRQAAVIGPLPACDGLPCRTRLAALATMTTPLLVLQGDDEALDVAHSAALTRTVPDGRLAVLPGPSHKLPGAKPELVGLILLEYFEDGAR